MNAPGHESLALVAAEDAPEPLRAALLEHVAHLMCGARFPDFTREATHSPDEPAPPDWAARESELLSDEPCADAFTSSRGRKATGHDFAYGVKAEEIRNWRLPHYWYGHGPGLPPSRFVAEVAPVIAAGRWRQAAFMCGVFTHWCELWTYVPKAAQHAFGPHKERVLALPRGLPGLTPIGQNFVLGNLYPEDGPLNPAALRALVAPYAAQAAGSPAERLADRTERTEVGSAKALDERWRQLIVRQRETLAPPYVASYLAACCGAPDRAKDLLPLLGQSLADTLALCHATFQAAAKWASGAPATSVHGDGPDVAASQIPASAALAVQPRLSEDWLAALPALLDRWETAVADAQHAACRAVPGDPSVDQPDEWRAAHDFVAALDECRTGYRSVTEGEVSFSGPFDLPERGVSVQVDSAAACGHRLVIPMPERRRHGAASVPAPGAAPPEVRAAVVMRPIRFGAAPTRAAFAEHSLLLPELNTDVSGIRLRFAIGALLPTEQPSPAAYGIQFLVSLQCERTGETVTLLRHWMQLNPTAQWPWRHYICTLDQWAGRRVTLRLETAAGPDFGCDKKLGAWATPVVEVRATAA